MKVAVVGHVEWVAFLCLERPLATGEIFRARDGWEEAGGGGAVAAAELARLAGGCTLFTALGSDAVGQGVPGALSPHGIRVTGPTRPGPHRRGVTLVEPDGERTIVVHGEVQAPRVGDDLPLDGFDAVYFCKGDADALRRARSARVLVATARELPTLQAAGVRLDALVHSARDPGERYAPGDLDPAPMLVATTEGASGGAWATADRRGRWSAAPPPGPVLDAYGAGDSFAAALTFALARGLPVEEALAFAATRGAAALTRRGAHGRPQPGGP